MSGPVITLDNQEDLTLDGIKQFYLPLEQENCKLDSLMKLYKTLTTEQTIIFCNTIRKVEFLIHELKSRHFEVVTPYEEMIWKEREDIMEKFRSGSAKILVTLDTFARGIDVEGVSVVINYDIPKDKENYLHRIGRSGRFGSKIIVINFVNTNSDELTTLLEIEKFYQTQIKEF